MNDKLVIGIGQAHEPALAFARDDWTNPELKRLSEGDILAQVRQVILGHAEIKVVEHVIDCSAPPFCPENWTVMPPEEQLPKRFNGSLKWDRQAQTEVFYLSKKQTTGKKWIEGNKLRKKLTDTLVVALPANVLDYLLANPHLIPEEWKGRAVFFWGTIYRLSDGSLCVRCLDWGGSSWYWGYRWLGDDWDSDDPAALPASQNQALGTLVLHLVLGHLVL